MHNDFKACRDLSDSLPRFNSLFEHVVVAKPRGHFCATCFNSALRRAFGLEELENQLTSDLTEMSERVQAAVALASDQRKRLFRKRFRWIPMTIASGVTAVAVLDIASVVQGFSADGRWSAAEGAWLLGAITASILAAVWIERTIYSDDDQR